MSEANSPINARDHLAIALDVPDSDLALRLATQLKPYFQVAKIGLELFSATGPAMVEELKNLGFDVFCDLKLFDIPNTVQRAAQVIGSLGASYLTVHTAGGLDMVKAGHEGFHAGANENSFPEPNLLGVTVLTSEPDASALADRVATALDGRCEGVICAAPDLAQVHSLAPSLLKVVPGIRPAGSDVGDQARVATPGEAMAAGASILVIGRPVTQAPDPVAAAAAIMHELG